MDFTLGDALIVAMPAAILVTVIWAVNHALKPRDFGISDAERYQRELAERSAAHQAEQARAALAARARINASTLPSQNEQQARQQSESHQPLQDAAARPPAGHQAAAGAPASGRRLQAVLPNGQLNPEFVRQLQTMARNGQKIQAIKLLREYTRTDLLSAKNYIDRL
ncbi:hypothetical protein [Arthrobacter sp. R-11]|uniref:hypothetical protein n=1 Tax=Arthrobacter sp. R-11 TaxID=3404053 RepID=UPI003CF4AABD